MKVELRYMVVPEELRKNAYVVDAVKVRILATGTLVDMGFLGESGKKLADAGLSFYFNGKDAQELIEMGLVERIENENK